VSRQRLPAAPPEGEVIKRIETHIDLSAVPSVVWEHLVDAEAMGNGESFITSLSGVLTPVAAQGAYRARRGRPMTFKPRGEPVDRSLAARPMSFLTGPTCWLGHEPLEPRRDRLSSVQSRYQHGSAFHAGGADGVAAKAAAADGRVSMAKCCA